MRESLRLADCSGSAGGSAAAVSARKAYSSRLGAVVADRTGWTGVTTTAMFELEC